MRGVPIVDAAHEAGYFDQPHLTRSFKRLIGQTPSNVRQDGSQQLSFLYKTAPFASP
jgi:AraC-like DNA-binding protein